MAKYLLDTTALVDHLRGRPRAIDLLTQLANDGHELGTCAVNVAELYSGLSERDAARARQLIQSLVYYDISRHEAQVAGEYRYGLARKGETLTLADALVASVAVAQGATLVTANVRHYPLEDVKLLDHS